MRRGRGAFLLLSALVACAPGPPRGCPEPLPWFVDADGDGYGDPTRYTLACAAPDGFVQDATDCDDGDGRIYPFAAEACDGIDNDCDREVDEGWTYSLWYPDADGDGWGDGWAPRSDCVAPPGHVARAGDCDDGDPGRHPEAGERCGGGDHDCDGLLGDDDPDLLASEGTISYADADGDGFGDPHTAVRACVHEPGRVTDATDCDDADPWTHPDALEVCDGRDNDCDRLYDDSDPDLDTLTQRTWFLDADGDGWGDPHTALRTCTEPWYWVLNALDCDDDDPEVGPIDGMRWRFDQDGDGVGADPPSEVRCDRPGPGWVPADRGVDCDDLDPSRAPGLPELCDGFDNDCDGLIDDEDELDPHVALAYFEDLDGDGHGGAERFACVLPPYAVFAGGDCDDADAFVFPGATERCNGEDDDCDGLIDDADPDRDTTFGIRVHRDADGDGFGDPFVASRACAVQPGWSSNAGDCDDTDATLGPPTMWWADADGDRFGSGSTTGPSCSGPPGWVPRGEEDCDDDDPTVKPGALEQCDDGIDQDCDGVDLPCPRPSCEAVLADGLSTGDGVYTIAPDGVPVEVWCDMTADGGGWTLVASSDTPFDDAASAYDPLLSTLTPAGAMAGMWDGLRDVLPVLTDIRFACRQFTDDVGFAVDLVFYDVHWYHELTAGPDEQTCFNQENGLGADPPPARLDRIAGRYREAGNPWDRDGYLEGEDRCDDTDDFTVDFDDRGMDGNQNDGTDWGEDDGLPKCGRTGLGVAWFVFVR